MHEFENAHSLTCRTPYSSPDRPNAKIEMTFDFGVNAFGRSLSTDRPSQKLQLVGAHDYFSEKRFVEVFRSLISEAKVLLQLASI